MQVLLHICAKGVANELQMATKVMSSPYKIMWQPFTDDFTLLRSSRYTANKKGDIYGSGLY